MVNRANLFQFHLYLTCLCLSLAPEPHVLLFRRPKDFEQQFQQQQLQQQALALNGKAAVRNGRKK
jgi:hypothetical protein